MGFFSEGRVSDSPYVEMIWRGQAGSNYTPTCPADSRWNLLFLRQNGRVQVSVEGPLTKAKAKSHAEGTEWLVIKFTLGTFLAFMPISDIADGEAILPLAARNSFWLHGFTWQFPNYQNVETFVDRLVHNDLLFRDPVVNAVLQDQPPTLSPRTVRRHFLLATGLTPKTLEQIERAQRAAELLEQGVSLLDAVDLAGYADQSHMTRALKYFIGQTPAQIARVKNPQ